MTKTNFEEISFRPVTECTGSEVADALTRSFEGYLVPVNVSTRAYERRFRGEGLDPFASRVYFENGSPVGVLLITRRGWTSRIAGMGITPKARGRGVGRRVMREAIRDAEERGDRSLVLEVFEENTPALSLYAGLGFRTERRLVGYWRERDEVAPKSPEKLSELNPLDFARVVAREGEVDLPWMLTAETLSASTPPARAYHLKGHAYALIDDPGAKTLVLSGFVVPRSDRCNGWGSRLLRALEAAFPKRSWMIPAIVPEHLVGSFLMASGWQRQPLTHSGLHVR